MHDTPGEYAEHPHVRKVLEKARRRVDSESLKEARLSERAHRILRLRNESFVKVDANGEE